MTPLRFTAPVRLTAAGKPRRLHIVGYTGVPLDLAGWPLPVVVDLAGLTLPPSVPLLADHQNALSAIVGSGRPETDGKTLAVHGTPANTAVGREVVAMLADGHALQASLGADPLEHRAVKDGESESVNGRTITVPGGFIVVTRSVLREMTITALGADGNTSVSLAAARRLKGSSMTFDSWCQSIGTDPTTLTEEQRAELQKAYNALYPTDPEETPAEGPVPTNAAWTGAAVLAENCPHLIAQASRERWSLSRCNKEALAALRASRGPGPANIVVGKGSPGTTSQSLEAALMVRCGFEKAALKAYGERTLEASRPMHRAAMPDLIAASMRLAGRTVPHDRGEMIRAALSTFDGVTTMLSNVANKVLESTWMETPATWRSWCAIRSANDFKQHVGLRPAFPGNLVQMPEGVGFTHGTVKEETYNWRVRTYGKTYGISRQAMINDDLSALSDIVPSLGKAALRSVSNLVYYVLMQNTGSFFHANNANLNTTASLTLPTLAAAVSALRAQTDLSGNVIDMQPSVLLVPPALEVLAREILNSSEVMRDVSSVDRQPTGNSMQGIAALEVEPRLSAGVADPDYVPGATGTPTTASGSASTWYLFASPADLPMIVGFLNGKETPTIETFGLDHDADKLEMTFRCYHDYGVAFGDYRAAQKNTA